MLKKKLSSSLAFAVLTCLLYSHANAQNLTFQDIQKLSAAPADFRIHYGDGPQQFGDLRVPFRGKRHPVVLVIHGGCWYSEYDLKHVSAFAEALRGLGFATWTIEYRRVGDEGGGWPGTFEDVERGADFLRKLSKTFSLDLNRVAVVGHSAGGQLALWLAARKADSGIARDDATKPLRVRGVISLAGITDMRKFGSRCGDAVTKLLGGGPSEFPERFERTSPVELLPARIPQRLIHGGRDKIVPVELGREYEERAKRSGGDVELKVIEEVGHFELIAPNSAAWPVVKETLLNLFGRNLKDYASRTDRRKTRN